MTTARDMLFQDVLAVAHRLGTNRSLQKPDIDVLLDRFRIQSKPSKSLQADLTARETLSIELIQALSQSKMEPAMAIKEVVASYRMQLKSELPASNNSIAPAKKSRKVNMPAATATTLKKDRNLALAKAGANSQVHQADAIAGGPKKKTASRGACPKCRSAGVVLAKSYSGDEYFSCIYCGFQAYRRQIDADLDLPLAAELLGRRFDEGDRE